MGITFLLPFRISLYFFYKYKILKVNKQIKTKVWLDKTYLISIKNCIRKLYFFYVRANRCLKIFSYATSKSAQSIVEIEKYNVINGNYYTNLSYLLYCTVQHKEFISLQTALRIRISVITGSRFILYTFFKIS